MKPSTDKLYMNPRTGSVHSYNDWFYVNVHGVEVNAVDLGEVVEVVPDKDNGFVEVTP